MHPTISMAVPEQAVTLANLINAAYRGETSRLGWTTEADILDGLRTDPDEIAKLLLDNEVRLLCCRDAAELLGCVLLRRESAAVASLSMLSVLPTKQGGGIGKQLLNAAEQLARQHWDTQRMTMWVIPRRDELIAYYLRRGYRRSGEIAAFPQDSRWTAKVDGLTLERLEKPLIPTD